MSLAHDTLGLELRPDDIIEAVRLGRQTLNSGRGNSPLSHRRPRSILIRTTGKAVQRKIMACRGPKLKPHGKCLNEDLSRSEQAARKSLVPVLKEFRENGVRC